MPRKPDIPENVYVVLADFFLRVRISKNESAETKARWHSELRAKVGTKAADLAWRMLEADLSPSQVVQIFNGAVTLNQNVNPGGQNVTQTAGGDMMGVNATGTQTIRDITIYKQELDQSGAVISAPVRQALIEAREEIEKADIEAALKPIIVDNFDKLTNELKKGGAKNADVASGLWTMVYGVVRGIPAAVSALVALDKLRVLLGY